TAHSEPAKVGNEDHAGRVVWIQPGTERVSFSVQGLGSGEQRWQIRKAGEAFSPGPGCPQAFTTRSPPLPSDWLSPGRDRLEGRLVPMPGVSRQLGYLAAEKLTAQAASVLPGSAVSTPSSRKAMSARYRTASW